MEEEKVKIEIFNNIIKIHLGIRCDCGKYQGIRYRGVICDRCGIEVRQNRIIKINRDVWSKGDFKEIIYPLKKKKVIDDSPLLI